MSITTNSSPVILFPKNLLTKPTSWSKLPIMEFTKTQEKIFNSAKTLMLSKGYPATTVDKICANAKVSKGSFYHSFSSKEELGIRLLEWYQQGENEQLFGATFKDLDEPRQRMFGFLDHAEKSSKRLWGNGCLLASLGIELAETNPKIRNQVSGIFKKLTLRLETIFEPAATRKGSPSAKELAEQFLIMLEGSIVLARVSKNWGAVNRGFQSFRKLLESSSK